MRIVILLSFAAFIAVPPVAHASERLSAECRREVVQLCGINRDTMRDCLRDKNDQVSKSCFAEIREKAKQKMGGVERKGQPKSDADRAALGGVSYAYGSDPLQKLEFYAAKSGSCAPLIIFVHGGGWKRGDMDNATGLAKIKHYRELGYNFATLNYRLVPQATVEQQAGDVADAVGYLISNAAKLGFDKNRVVLMGHSAGAHLSALVGTDPQYLRAAGLSLSALAGVIPIDGAAYDVPQQLVDGNRIMQDTYKQAFGDDPVRQRALSPTFQAASPNAPSFLILHIDRDDGTRQSQALSSALRQSGTRVQINAVDGKGLTGHMEINRKLGDPTYPATPVVDAWLRALFGV